jgi:hypothetical protein
MEENLIHHYELRIPTEQYAYFHCNYTGTLEGAVEHYQEMKQALAPKVGLSSKDFNSFLDIYLSTGHAPPLVGVELWEQMSDLQKTIINECKKSLKRTNK